MGLVLSACGSSRSEIAVGDPAPSGEPGHTFVLVNTDGTIAWIRDYGAPENGGIMYVPVGEITRQIETHLGG
jgi:hypothetical protein